METITFNSLRVDELVTTANTQILLLEQLANIQDINIHGLQMSHSQVQDDVQFVHIGGVLAKRILVEGAIIEGSTFS